MAKEPVLLVDDPLYVHHYNKQLHRDNAWTEGEDFTQPSNHDVSLHTPPPPPQVVCEPYNSG